MLETSSFLEAQLIEGGAYLLSLAAFPSPTLNGGLGTHLQLGELGAVRKKSHSFGQDLNLGPLVC